MVVLGEELKKRVLLMLTARINDSQHFNNLTGDG